jgi:hypothetical protein
MGLFLLLFFNALGRNTNKGLTRAAKTTWCSALGTKGENTGLLKRYKTGLLELEIAGLGKSKAAGLKKEAKATGLIESKITWLIKEKGATGGETKGATPLGLAWCINTGASKGTGTKIRWYTNVLVQTGKARKGTAINARILFLPHLVSYKIHVFFIN